jgi:hypothetical protein
MARARSRRAKQAPGEQIKLQENTEQALERHREEERRGNTYSMPKRYHRGMARQCPRGHDGIKPGEVPTCRHIT